MRTQPAVFDIALLPGSLRRGSVHRQLARALVPVFEARGTQPSLIDLGDYPMSMYHGDDEASSGQPAAAVALAERIAAADGLVILSPEYNGGPSALLKNAIDWVTRVDREVLRSPVIGLAAASPGPRGARHGLSVMRQMSIHMRLDVIPTDLSIASCADAFEQVDGQDRLARPDAADDAGRFAADLLDAIARRFGGGEDSAAG